MLSEPVTDRLQEVEQILRDHDQAALLQRLAAMPPVARVRLLEQLAVWDLPELFRAAAAHSARRPAPRPALEPGPVVRLEADARDAARTRGLEALREGRVAALVVAGGLGTRLGFDAPKGTYPIGPVSGRSLFAHHAAQILGAGRKAGRTLPWVVMTSERTAAATRRHFEDHANFGLDPADIHFISQHELPCLTPDGALLFDAEGRLVTSPDGHGGLFEALRASAVPATLAARGVEVVSYFQVDNPLLPVIDPVAIGQHLSARVEWTAKLIEKAHPDEKLGAWVRGNPGRVVEYTELDAAERNARDGEGGLRLGAGSMGAHLLSLALLARVTSSRDPLPLHVSPKRIRLGPEDAAGSEPNALKLERFVFDALPRARSAQGLHIERADEYTPVKNARGVHSPEAARAALGARARRWLAAAGIDPPTGTIELDAAHWPDAAALREAHVRTVAELGDSILIDQGGPS